MNNVANGHGRGFILAMILMGAVAPSAFYAFPQLVSQSAAAWGFSESQLGLAVFLEIGGTAVGALAVAFLLSDWPVRRTLALGVLLVAAANFATSLVHGIEAYYAVRLVAGAASGMLGAIAMRYLSFTANPDRDFGYLVIGQALWAMVLLGWIVPTVGEQWQAVGSYAFIGMAALPFLLCLRSLPRDESLAPPEAGGGNVNQLGAYTTLAALFVLYIGVGVTWTFVDQIGQRAGYEADFIANVLAGANFAAAIPCLVLPRLTAMGSANRWCLVMMIGCAAGSAMLGLPTTPALFVGAVVLFVAAWSGAAMLIFATVPKYDAVGRHTALSPGFLGIGYGVGSVFAGQLLEQGMLQGAIALSSLSCIVAVLIYSSLRRIPTRI